VTAGKTNMLLAIDTSTRQMGVALYDGERVVNEQTWASPFHHTVELAPSVAVALERAGVTVADVQALAVARGPGSFTSLRVGLAFAKGLALARHLPLFGVPTLDFLAAAQPLDRGPLAAVLEAGRTRLAVGWYQAQQNTWVPTGLDLLSPADFLDRIQQPTWVCGELSPEVYTLLRGKKALVQLAPAALSHRRPAFLAELAWARWQTGPADDPNTLAPIYLSHNL